MRDKLPGNGGGRSCCRNLGVFLVMEYFLHSDWICRNCFLENNVNENFHHKVAVFYQKAVMTVKET